MRRKTIGANPLAALAHAKGKKKAKLPAAPELQSEIREFLIKPHGKAKPHKRSTSRAHRDGGMGGWLKSVWKGLAG